MVSEYVKLKFNKNEYNIEIYEITTMSSKEDKFKKSLFELIEEKTKNAKSDESIINTIENYIWPKVHFKQEYSKRYESI